jgi:predicted PurR-regulated permease PerM
MWPRHPFPLSIKPILNLALVVLVLVVFLYLKTILVPLLLSTFIAMLLHPAQQFMEKKWKIRKEICALILLVALLTLVLLFLTFVTAQFSRMGNHTNEIVVNIRIYLSDIKIWLQKEWDLPEKRWNFLLEYIKSELIQQSENLIRQAVKEFSGMLFNLLLIPVYVFLLLIYRHSFKTYVLEVSRKNGYHALSKSIDKFTGIGPVYLRGLLIEMLLVFTMTAIGLYITGVPYPIFLAASAALFNLIPYVGNLMAGSLAILTALAFTNELYTMLAAFCVSALVQVIDNNLIIPKIVASGIKINPLIAMSGIIGGGIVAGLAGMFMAIPFLAIIKIVCDASTDWKAMGKLIGELRK